MPLALIQLISDQTMQNLVPLLALKPAKVFHLATPRTAARSSDIIEAASQAQVPAELELVRLTEMPSIPETSRAVVRAIEAARSAGLTPVVNFTGGTKLMSIGAYEAAMRQEVTSLYVDTDREQFLDGHSGPKLNTILGDDLSFTPFHPLLTVNAVAIAHGRQRVTDGRKWEPFLPLARHLFSHPQDEQATHDTLFGRDGFCRNGYMPQQPEDWLTILDREFSLLPAVRDLAIKANLVLPASAGAVRLPDSTRTQLQALVNARAKKEYIQDYDKRRVAATAVPMNSLVFLTGGWWEVTVADAAARSGAFRDLRWSADVGEQGGADLEEDLIGLDGVRITYVSCKRGGGKARLLPLLEEINARAHRLGGNFTRRFLAIYLAPKGPVARNLTQRARELGISLLTPQSLEKPDFFSARPPV